MNNIQEQFQEQCGNIVENWDAVKTLILNESDRRKGTDDAIEINGEEAPKTAFKRIDLKIKEIKIIIENLCKLDEETFDEIPDNEKNQIIHAITSINGMAATWHNIRNQITGYINNDEVESAPIQNYADQIFQNEVSLRNHVSLLKYYYHSIDYLIVNRGGSKFRTSLAKAESFDDKIVEFEEKFGKIAKFASAQESKHNETMKSLEEDQAEIKRLLEKSSAVLGESGAAGLADHFSRKTGEIKKNMLWINGILGFLIAIPIASSITITILNLLGSINITYLSIILTLVLITPLGIGIYIVAGIRKRSLRTLELYEEKEILGLTFHGIVEVSPEEDIESTKRNLIELLARPIENILDKREKRKWTWLPNAKSNQEKEAEE